MAEEIYGCSSVEMSSELDYKGVDLRIKSNDKFNNVQIKKDTVSREVQRPWSKQKPAFKEPIIIVEYEVPEDPYKKYGNCRKPYLRWKKKWAGKLKRLDNGFIIFLP